MEQVVPAFKHWEKELESLFGNKKKTTTENFAGQAARDRFFFRSHKHDELDKWEHKLWVETEEEKKVDNGFYWRNGENGENWSSWPHKQQWMERKPPTQKTYYPTLVLRNGNPDDFDKLQEWEKSFLGKMKIHSSQGEGMFAGPREVATWMGLSKQEMEKIKEAFPCTPVVDRLYDMEHWRGNQFGPTEKEFTKCGQRRFCNNCTITLKCMGNAWNKKVAIEECLKVILPALKGMEAFNFQTVRAHQCKERCYLVETLAEAKLKEGANPAKQQQPKKMENQQDLIEI